MADNPGKGGGGGKKGKGKGKGHGGSSEQQPAQPRQQQPAQPRQQQPAQPKQQQPAQPKQQQQAQPKQQKQQHTQPQQQKQQQPQPQQQGGGAKKAWGSQQAQQGGPQQQPQAAPPPPQAAPKAPQPAAAQQPQASQQAPQQLGQKAGEKKKGSGGDAPGASQQPQAAQPPPSAQQAPQQQGQKGGGKKKGGGGDAAGAAAAVQATTQLLSQVSMQESATGGKGAIYPIPRRTNPKGGSLGQKIMVDTNHFAIQFRDPNIVIFHYDVAMDPDKPAVHMRPVMHKVARQYFPNEPYGYDGKKNLFSKGALSFGVAMNCTITIFDEERMRDKEYKVEIKKAQEIRFSSIVDYMRSGNNKPQIAIQALDVILREPSCNNPAFVKIGSSYFAPPDPNRIFDLGDGLHLWNGFYQSAGIGWRPFLNLDVAHKGFPVQMPVTAILNEITRGNMQQELRDWDKEALKSRCGGMKVIYEIPGLPNSKKIFKVNRIVGCAMNERFKMDNDSREITIADYFARSKNYRLQYPKMPCFQVGSVAKNMRIPAELCTVLGGQVSNKKMNENQTANMVKAAATGTDIRRNKVMDAMRKINFGGSRLLQDFGIGVSDKMERVDARILAPPSVGYSGRELRVERGVWRADKFLKPCNPISSWAVVNMVPGHRVPNLRAIQEHFPRGAQTVGVQFAPQPAHVADNYQDNNRNLRQLFEGFKQRQIQVVFVVVPNSGDIYSKVKQVAELEVGILTQCIREKTVFKMNPATTGNLLLKINAKLNGTNHWVPNLKKPKILGKPTIIFGADVTHPSPDETSIPSVAAVTSSYDPAAFKYNMMWNLQDPRQEIIVQLEAIVKAQLMYFFKVNNRKPEHIIFYRDGVSEGYFQRVLSAELSAIKRACASMEQGYNPGVTFLVVQKRHHTRFFPCTPNEGDGTRNNNVRPGTIVDTTITHPTDLDFYLVSHASIQGTARPTKYYKLWDDYKGNLTDDDIEEMTYYLCHLFTRCTRAVSYPAPTYYAHLAAFRGRVYIKNKHLNMNNLDRENQTLQARPDFLQSNPMYFV